MCPFVTIYVFIRRIKKLFYATEFYTCVYRITAND